MTEKDAMEILHVNGIDLSKQDFSELLTDMMWEEARGMIAVALANECLCCPWKVLVKKNGENICDSCCSKENLENLCKMMIRIGEQQGRKLINCCEDTLKKLFANRRKGNGGK